MSRRNRAGSLKAGKGNVNDEDPVLSGSEELPAGFPATTTSTSTPSTITTSTMSSIQSAAETSVNEGSQNSLHTLTSPDAPFVNTDAMVGTIHQSFDEFRESAGFELTMAVVWRCTLKRLEECAHRGGNSIDLRVSPI